MVWPYAAPRAERSFPFSPSRRIGQYGEGERPRDAAELASRLLTTVYMGTEARLRPPASVCLQSCSDCAAVRGNPTNVHTAAVLPHSRCIALRGVTEAWVGFCGLGQLVAGAAEVSKDATILSSAIY